MIRRITAGRESGGSLHQRGPADQHNQRGPHSHHGAERCEAGGPALGPADRERLGQVSPDQEGADHEAGGEHHGEPQRKPQGPGVDRIPKLSHTPTLPPTKSI